MKYLVITIVSLGLALILSLVMLILSSGSYNKTLEKSSPFECGFLGLEESRSPFSVHFFMVSLIFLIFDIELVILFPYLGSLWHSPSLDQELAVLGFVFILLIGLVVEWEKSMLEWQS